jgi:hypothetical protein
MLYRFLSKLATQDRLQAFPVPCPGDAFWLANESSAETYKKVLKPGVDETRRYGVEVLRSPEFAADQRRLRLRFHPGREENTDLPDLWGVAGRLIASERAKQVIEAADDFGHEFIEIGWIDANEAPVTTEQRYYWFNPLRFLTIPPSERIATGAELGFCPIPLEEDFHAHVLDDRPLHERIAQIPLWRHFRDLGPGARRTPIRMVVFFNQALAEALWAIDARGFERYSQPFGVGEEAVAGVGKPLNGARKPS